MSESSLTRDTPRSPPSRPTPSYIPYPGSFPSDLDTRDGIPRGAPRSSVFSHRHLPSLAPSTQSWVNSNLLSPPAPPSEQNQIATPAYGSRTLPNILESRHYSYSQDEEYMNIDPADRGPGDGWTNGYPTYPMPEHQQQTYYSDAPQQDLGFNSNVAQHVEEKKPGGFFYSLRRLNPLRKRKKGPARTAGAIPVMQGTDAQEYPSIPPDYSSNPPTPIAPVPSESASVQYVQAMEMPIPETDSPPIDSREQYNQSIASHREPLSVFVVPPSDTSGGDTTRPPRSESVHTHVSDRRPPSRHDNDDRADSRQTSTGSHSDTDEPQTPQGPVLADLHPAEDYRKMSIPSSGSASRSDPSIGEHISRVQKFVKDVGGLPWMSRGRITMDYRPGSRGRGGRILHVGSHGKPPPDKPSESWYTPGSPGHKSVDLLSNGTPSASSAMSPTASSSSSAPFRSPRRRVSAEELATSPRSNYRRREAYESPSSSNSSRYEPPRHRGHDDSRRRTSPRRHHHHHRHHDSHHRHHARAHDVLPIPTLAYQPAAPAYPQTYPQAYPQTYIQYPPPIAQTQIVYSPPQQPQPLFFVQQRPGSGETATPVPNAIRLSPDLRQLPHVQQQNIPIENQQQHSQPRSPNPRPQIQQPTPQSMQQVSPIYVVGSPAYVRAQPLQNIAMPGQYAYPYSLPGPPPPPSAHPH
ncbi:hypothetical protein HGRIS_014035 [Hohenbuehelia grisea]|uniref:Uncharacterized protein n=1 Tax=Hohenbuehelia grisea TaxID=104357 RepID=A0ABR3JST0_9AGAR